MLETPFSSAVQRVGTLQCMSEFGCPLYCKRFGTTSNWYLKISHQAKYSTFKGSRIVSWCIGLPSKNSITSVSLSIALFRSGLYLSLRLPKTCSLLVWQLVRLHLLLVNLCPELHLVQFQEQHA